MGFLTKNSQLTNKIGGILMKLLDMKALIKYRHIREVRILMFCALIAGIVIGLAISRLI